MVSETRYFRSDQQTVNTLTAYILGTAESSSLIELICGSDTTLYIGIRVWKVAADGTPTEITAGTAVAIASLGTGADSTTTINATYTPAQTALVSTDAIYITVYADVGINPPTTARANFITEQLGASQLDNVQWTVYYRVRRDRYGKVPNYFYDFYWRRGNAGNSTYITSFSWTSGQSKIPLIMHHFKHLMNGGQG